MGGQNSKSRLQCGEIPENGLRITGLSPWSPFVNKVDLFADILISLVDEYEEEIPITNLTEVTKSVLGGGDSCRFVVFNITTDSTREVQVDVNLIEESSQIPGAGFLSQKFGVQYVVEGIETASNMILRVLNGRRIGYSSRA